MGIVDAFFSVVETANGDILVGYPSFDRKIKMSKSKNVESEMLKTRNEVADEDAIVWVRLRKISTSIYFHFQQIYVRVNIRFLFSTFIFSIFSYFDITRENRFHVLVNQSTEQT